MSDNQKTKSIFLTFLMFTSLCVGLISIPVASAVTTSGTITASETWSGTVNLNGNVTVAEGATLVINGGTRINIPAGDQLIVEGSICAGDITCGAGAPSSQGAPIRFVWADASGSGPGNCAGAPLNNPDPSCGSGIWLDYTVDVQKTKLNYVTLEGTYGIPVQVQNGVYRYGALVLNDASIDARGLDFSDVNTTNILVVGSAAPTISDSTLTLGVDGRNYHGPALEAHNAGKGILGALTIRSTTISGGNSPSAGATCDSGQPGRSAMYFSNSDVDIDFVTVQDNSQGLFFQSSSGRITDSSITVTCNAVDTNSVKTSTNASTAMYIFNNTIETTEGAGITAYDNSVIVANDNTISGAASGSGVGIRDSTAQLHRNVIGPIGGWNGLWIYGESDVVAENNTIQNTAKEAISLGEYHYVDSWSSYKNEPEKSRLYLANNQINNVSGTCNSAMYGQAPEYAFPCPAMQMIMASATIIGNNFSEIAADAFKIKGSIVNIQDNEIDAGGANGEAEAVYMTPFDDNYGTKYGSIGFFSQNQWPSSVTKIYNITESKVIVQSENFPQLDNSSIAESIFLRWNSQTCEENSNACLKVPPTSEMVPKDMPIAMEIKENATTFTFANLNGFNIGDIYMRNQGSEWGVQVEEGELVRYQVKASNSNVAGANVKIRNAFGVQLYNLTTDSFGFTPQITLPTNFHIDHNWNRKWNEPDYTIHPVTGEYTADREDSCNDGVDNDGDGYADEQDSEDCSPGTNTREMSLFIVEASKFDKGRSTHTFTLDGMIDEIIHLDNMAPSVTVDQLNSTSFPKIVQLTGRAWDGFAGDNDGNYFNTANATDAMFGTVDRVEIQPHGSPDWYNAIDTSGANGVITSTNYPFKTWSFEWDMSDQAEQDVTFRIRAYDGLEVSQIATRFFRLNINAPTIFVDSPQDGSQHVNGIVTFEGRAEDDYRNNLDLDRVYIQIEGPGDFSSKVWQEASPSWSYVWNYAGTNLQSGDYTFTIWASDSNFCRGVIDVCVTKVLILTIDNENQAPIVQLDKPRPSQIIYSGEVVALEGVARDNDGSVSRVEFRLFDAATGGEMMNGPSDVTTFSASGVWTQTWDPSRANLANGQFYDIEVRSYDTVDFSEPVMRRIQYIDLGDTDNVPPEFSNPTLWPQTYTIFCDSNSLSDNRCTSVSINLLDFFSDPDGEGENNTHLRWDFNEPLYVDAITINPNSGVAKYNPMDYMESRSPDIADWSLLDVIFIGYDDNDVPVNSPAVDFIVKPISFSVERINDGQVISGNNAMYRGTGLPGSKVEARFADSDFLVNETLVGPDGVWRMEISYTQIGRDGDVNLVFSQDEGSITQQQLASGALAEAGMATWLWIVLIVLVIGLLGGAGAFFFLEFEELDEIEEAVSQQNVSEDPYAWAKAKQVPELPATNTQTLPAQQAPQAFGQAKNVVQQPAAPAQSQHPGWLWDAQSNQWVPDPNYRPPQ